MAKLQTKWLCKECGNTQSQWSGNCSGCKAWNTIEKFLESKTSSSRSSFGFSQTNQKPISILEVEIGAEERFTSGFTEVDKVFGGGIVRGSFTLIGGEPGIGKSTLMIQCAKNLADRGKKVLYVTGEESLSQAAMRAKRVKAEHKDLYLYQETSFSRIVHQIEELKPDFMILDSIQICHKEEITSPPGSVAQVKEIAISLMKIAKELSVTTLAVGHVTKGGDVAGPKVLEHIVDTVLEFEGDRDLEIRMLRSKKNRFGKSEEMAIFSMHEEGLKEEENPSMIFLEKRKSAQTGSAIGTILEGSRPIFIDIESLVVPTNAMTPTRKASGFDPVRLAIILAVLEKKVGMHFSSYDVFLSIAGGIKVKDPAVDLALSLSIASSFTNKKIDSDIVVIGEVGLGGEVRNVQKIQNRLKEVASHGFKKVVVPKGNKKIEDFEGLEIIEVSFVDEAIQKLLV
ncbi:MAG: DNA repair protein RadA [Chlamydiia bacterium]|nr:DNA repair protein RadA [Chlamydiia bacterium]